MLLAHYSVPLSRAQALRRFEAAPPHWRGASHRQIAGIVSTALPAMRSHWYCVRAQSTLGLRDAIARVSINGAPVLVTATCVLRRNGLRCRHAFLATASICAVGILDPLGARPSPTAGVNAMIKVGNALSSRHARVDGAIWNIDLSRRICLLRVVARVCAEGSSADSPIVEIERLTSRR